MFISRLLLTLNTIQNNMQLQWIGLDFDIETYLVQNVYCYSIYRKILINTISVVIVYTIYQ